MKNPFHRKPRKPYNITLDMDVTRIQHDVTHTVKYEPKPVPQHLAIIVRDRDGREYRLMPVSLYGQTEQRLDFPLAFITGNPGDPPVPMYMRLYYD